MSREAEDAPLFVVAGKVEEMVFEVVDEFALLARRETVDRRESLMLWCMARIRLGRGAVRGEGVVHDAEWVYLRGPGDTVRVPSRRRWSVYVA